MFAEEKDREPISHVLPRDACRGGRVWAAAGGWQAGDPLGHRS